MPTPYNVEHVRKTGLTVLYEPSTEVTPILDIVFVHGLQGHPRNTWTWEADGNQSSNLVPIDNVNKRNKLKFWSKRSKTDDVPSNSVAGVELSSTFWPYHLLPQDCPTARILTWGYDSNISHFFNGSSNQNNILAHSRDLLGDLSEQRGSSLNRPLVFIAHSLGGIVVKQMLLRASRSNDKSYEDIFKSTSAVFFLGTPHTGSPHAELGETLRKIIRVMGFDSAGQNLLTLRPDSILLDQCREEFHLLYKRGSFEVYTFQEARGMTGIGFAMFNDKVVPDTSSEFLGAEKRFTIDANHRTMCRFLSREDDGYRKLSRELMHILQSIKDLSENKTRIESNVERGNMIKSTCLSFLELLAYEEMDYREQEVRKAHLDSCNWILEHKSYTEWIAKRRGILGIKGKPGSGKSTLMKKIFRLFREFEDAKSIQLAFFFHRRGTSLQHTQIGMFRSLLHQLLKQIPSAGQAFYSLCERKRRWQGDSGKDWEWRLEELREAFSSTLLTTAKDHAVRIFIDALDEAGDDQAQEIVSYLYDMYEELFKLDAAVAVCFSCRHFPILAVNDGFEIVLEENNQKDIEEYASAELKKKMGNRGSSLDALRADIVSKASGVFMWVALVVPLVARQYNNGKSLETIRQTLNKVPSQLEEVYKHILTKVVDWDDRRQTLHLLQWIYLAERPLSVTELRHALASDDSVIKPAQYSCQKSKEFVENDDIMKRLIVSLSGGLAEVKHHGSSNHGQQDMVQFIHQSVNDFLSKDKFRCLELHEPVDLIGQGYHRLSRSCINYLQLHEVRHRTEVLDKWNDYYDRDKEKVKARLIVDIPLIEYATEFWFIHAEKAESYNIPQQNLLRRLKWPSNEFFLIWIKTFHAINELNNRRAGRGATLIHVAAASNLITALKAMLEKGANIESEDEEGNRPIHYAARWGQDRIVSFLLDAGAGIGDKNKDGKTALERAAGAGHEKVVDLLLGGGEGGLKFRVNGALLAAAEANEEKVMWLLLERGADANVQGGFYGSVLQAASFNGHEAIVRVLLERGAEANTQGGIHGNALQAAASQGNEAIVRALLERGAEVNAKGGYYGYALQAAACNGHEAIVRLLLEQGAEVSAQGGHWGNALKAAESGRPRQIYAKIVELLLEYMSKQERLEYRASEWEDVFDDNESEGVACTKDWLE